MTHDCRSKNFRRNNTDLSLRYLLVLILGMFIGLLISALMFTHQI